MEQLQLEQIPIRVNWAGWESDTYVLKRQGWQVFAAQQMSPKEYAMEIMVSVKAPDNKLMIMGRYKLRAEHLVQNRRALLEGLCQAGIDMQSYQATDKAAVYETPKYDWNMMNAMAPCDGFASVDLGPQVIGFDKLNLFKFTENPKEIYIPHSSVDECLNRILQLQFPKQDEIKRNGAKVERPVIQAKIYAMAA